MAKVELTLYGNGGEGIAEIVKNHEEMIQEIKGMTKIIKWFLWIGVPSLIISGITGAIQLVKGL